MSSHNQKKNLIINWDTLYVGLKKDWLSSKEVIEFVNSNSNLLSCDEQTLVELNINYEDKFYILKILETLKVDELNGLRLWQLSQLMNIAESKSPIKNKLNDIEIQWSRFDYPNEWRDFIYYMPIKGTNSPEDVYQNFLTYLNKEKQKLNVTPD